MTVWLSHCKITTVKRSHSEFIYKFIILYFILIWYSNRLALNWICFCINCRTLGLTLDSPNSLSGYDIDVIAQRYLMAYEKIKTFTLWQLFLHLTFVLSPNAKVCISAFVSRQITEHLPQYNSQESFFFQQKVLRNVAPHYITQKRIWRMLRATSSTTPFNTPINYNLNDNRYKFLRT